MDLSDWKRLIKKARIGTTLDELNSAYGTASGICDDERFGRSLNKALLELDEVNLQVRFDYGNRSSEILYIPNKETVYTFTKEHLDGLLEEYAFDFKWLTHILHAGTKHFFIYSESSRILISTCKSGGAPFGPIRLARDTSGVVEHLTEKKNLLYRSWKYSFSNPDRYIDVNTARSYTAIPISQARKLIRKGVAGIPTNMDTQAADMDLRSIDFEAVSEIADSVLNEFRDATSLHPNLTVEVFIEDAINDLADATEKSALLAWLQEQRISSGPISLFEFAFKRCLPEDASDELHYEILLKLDELFYERSQDLPPKATGAMTLDEALKDAQDYLQKKLDEES
jgi:hypothetical protein